MCREHDDDSTPLVFVRGSTPQRTILVTESDGVTPVDITGAVITLTCKACIDDVDPGLFQIDTKGGDIVLLDQVTNKGQFVFTIPDADTANLAAMMRYVYDCVINLAGYKQPLLWGPLILLKGVTNSY